MRIPKAEAIILQDLSAERSMSHAEEYAEDRVDDFLEQNGSYLNDDDQSDHTIRPVKHARQKLWSAFFCFGLLNNVLYVIILSAALDLVPASTPKGIVAFFNIFPALIAKAVWPYVSKGEIRYRKRVYCCTLCSWVGMIVSQSSSPVPFRNGISG
jgi:battenin